MGGFGIVYRAHDPRTRRDVALKIPRLEAMASGELRQRFEVEAAAAGKLDHPNIVQVLEAGSAGAIPYIASLYHEGLTLAAWIASHPHPPPPRQGAELVRILALAVHHAHTRGVLHRDIKPSNVLLALRTEGTALTISVSSRRN
ncbi:MAG: protein kinase [Planctomycetota bacterium]